MHGGNDVRTADESTTTTSVSGLQIPQIGLCTRFAHPTDIEQHITDALHHGICHLNTYHGYFGGEYQAASALTSYLASPPAESANHTRSKIWLTCSRPSLSSRPEREIKEYIQGLGVGYVDSFLIEGVHGGPRRRKMFWQALEVFKAAGLIRYLQVSDFSIKQVREIAEYAKHPVDFVRVSMSPFNPHQQITDYYEDRQAVRNMELEIGYEFEGITRIWIQQNSHILVLDIEAAIESADYILRPEQLRAINALGNRSRDDSMTEDDYSCSDEGEWEGSWSSPGTL